jgi:hypothetical protein
MSCPKGYHRSVVECHITSIIPKPRNVGIYNIIYINYSYKNYLHLDLNLGQILVFVPFASIICSSSQTTLVLASFVYRVQFPIIENHIIWCRTQVYFRYCDLRFCNLFFKETTSTLALYLYRSYFPSYGIHPYRDTNPGQLFQGYGHSFCQFPLRKKQLRSWRRSSVKFNFRAAGSTLIGTRTQDSCFWVLTF